MFSLIGKAVGLLSGAKTYLAAIAAIAAVLSGIANGSIGWYEGVTAISIAIGQMTQRAATAKVATKVDNVAVATNVVSDQVAAVQTSTQGRVAPSPSSGNLGNNFGSAKDRK